MADDVIPQDVQHFILLNIDSIAQLEGLLLLRTVPQKEWSAETVAARLYITEPEATVVLSALVSRGILAQSKQGKSTAYRYEPSTPELDEMVSSVAHLYSRYLVPVTHLVHSKPKSRIQEFSDAFRIRKD